MDRWTVFDSVYPPREDSRLMVEVLEKHDFSGKHVLDMGTGTGILAYVALQQGAEAVTAVDVNPVALRNAMENIGESEVDVNRAVFVESDLFKKVSESFDVIVFNPPYVPGEEELGTEEEKAWRGGEQGREVTDRFIEKIGQHLVETGEVFLLQSSLNDVELTRDRFEDRGFTVEIVAEDKLPWEKLVVLHAVLD